MDNSGGLIGLVMGLIVTSIMVPRMVSMAKKQGCDDLVTKRPKDIIEIRTNLPSKEVFDRVVSLAKAYDYEIKYLLKENGCIILAQPISCFSFGFFYPVYISAAKSDTMVQVGIKSRYMQDQRWNLVRLRRKKIFVDRIKMIL